MAETTNKAWNIQPDKLVDKKHIAFKGKPEPWFDTKYLLRRLETVDKMGVSSPIYRLALSLFDPQESAIQAVIQEYDVTPLLQPLRYDRAVEIHSDNDNNITLFSEHHPGDRTHVATWTLTQQAARQYKIYCTDYPPEVITTGTDTEQVRRVIEHYKAQQKEYMSHKAEYSAGAPYLKAMFLHAYNDNGENALEDITSVFAKWQHIKDSVCHQATSKTELFYRAVCREQQVFAWDLTKTPKQNYRQLNRIANLEMETFEKRYPNNQTLLNAKISLRKHTTFECLLRAVYEVEVDGQPVFATYFNHHDHEIQPLIAKYQNPNSSPSDLLKARTDFENLVIQWTNQLKPKELLDNASTSKRDPFTPGSHRSHAATTSSSKTTYRRSKDGKTFPTPFTQTEINSLTNSELSCLWSETKIKPNSKFQKSPLCVFCGGMHSSGDCRKAKQWFESGKRGERDDNILHSARNKNRKRRQDASKQKGKTATQSPPSNTTTVTSTERANQTTNCNVCSTPTCTNTGTSGCPVSSCQFGPINKPALCNVCYQAHVPMCIQNAHSIVAQQAHAAATNQGFMQYNPMQQQPYFNPLPMHQQQFIPSEQQSMQTEGRP